MAPSRKADKAKSRPSSTPEGSIPKPFKRASDSLQPFTSTLSKKHVYVTHIDSKPADFKRKIFLVPVAMNVATVVLLGWRVWYILPYYFQLIISALGNTNETTFDVAGSTWGELAWIIGRRTFTVLIDFLLVTYVLPEPAQFFFGVDHGNPVHWRWAVGFREQEVYVRRSTQWDESVLPGLWSKDETKPLQAFLLAIQQATSPMLLGEKTGYLTMSPAWALDWQGMVDATRLVDKKDIAPEAFRTVVLVHHPTFGWLSMDALGAVSASEDDKRRQVFAFRDALAAVGKEDVFFRWIEIVQFESSQPGGFGPEKQEETAKKIRELFEQNDIDFDQFWKESVGS